ncbi:hypothetical protein GS429_08830 [Natronorubrum sp. JWXQ-INN-674]|uniref:Halobacterial output domain-containing protein n=1 Tax=Natronorubrum halalkaliphilum TaxID=2691917 RepID=A0A6B0VLS0_9EURY|nr:HalOD1 output domain-containing protein [Natronorubrum halalkaliphilum]MXV62163.1 hypothetical protein [Natronorubrum halalkaliphilum]
MPYDTPYRLVLDDNDRPSVRIIESVRAITGSARDELRPLHSAIDAESLDTLHRTNVETTVSFEYEGFHITVHPDGELLFRDPESIHTKLETASNVLLLAPSKDDKSLCTDLLHPHPPENENILSVVTDRTVEEEANSWAGTNQPQPAERKVISLGEFARSAGTRTVTLPDSTEADLIGDEADLSTLGDRIHRSLTAWESNSNVSTICFQSVDSLIDHTDLEQTISFFHALLPRLEELDSIAHYHLDPLECEQSEVNVLLPLFDAVIYEDGEHTARL